jgi:hypothetical protein
MGIARMNKVRERLALRAIGARLSREEPELALLLRFGHGGPAAQAIHRRERRVLVGAVGGLAMLFTFTFSFLVGPPTSYAHSSGVAPTATAQR